MFPSSSNNLPSEVLKEIFTYVQKNATKNPVFPYQLHSDFTFNPFQPIYHPPPPLPPPVFNHSFIALHRLGYPSNIPMKKTTDLQECSLVSKAWRSVALEFFRPDMPLKVTEEVLPRLLKDIPYFAHKVTSITVKPKISYQIPFNQDDCNQSIKAWVDILFMCPNLVSVTLEIYNPALYIQALYNNNNSPTRKLSNLHHLNIVKLENLTSDQKRMLLSICIDNQETMTNIWIGSIDHVPGYYLEYDELLDFVLQFPKLKRLTIEGRNNLRFKSTIDLHRLIKQIPTLEELSLINFTEIKSSSSEDDDQNSTRTPLLLDLKLSKLQLESKKMDVKLMRYMMKQFKHLTHLRLDIMSLTSYVAPAREETFALTDELIAYTKEMKSSYVKYHYGCLTYYFENGSKSFVSDSEEENSDEYGYSDSNDGGRRYGRRGYGSDSDEYDGYSDSDY
ncbi:hypothetical protein BD770DRAFT_388343 [Pilaira anomala]|nr:hypothetical protein BD770DRAFT_388343 [Pilaira anomala]